MIGKAIQPASQPWIVLRGLAAFPAASAVRADLRVGIVAERRCKRLFISCFRAQPCNRRRARALLERARQGLMFGARGG
jgi:hypothetical protein